MALIKAINAAKRSLAQGINYITNPDKTEETLISGKDCDAQQVLEEMQTTKELYGKTQGRQYKHFVQSFSPNDPIDPSKAHQIGFEMAQKAFPGYEVLVATHTDKDHLHNHFIVNSVNFETGAKYRQSISELMDIKELSNEICEREGLHVMTKEEQTPGKSLSMNEYQVAVKGESWKFKLMGEIDQSRETSRSKEDFIKSMESKGYHVKWTDERKFITYSTPGGHKVRDNKLHDPNYLKEAMEDELKNGRIKKLNDSPVRQEEATVKQTSSHGENEITAENIQIILSEHLSLSALIRGRMQESEKNETSLTKKLEESERLRNFEIKRLAQINTVLNERMEKLEKVNYQKMERDSEIINEEARKTQESNSKIIREVMDLAHQVKTIPNPNWKERAKQYGTQLLITVGLATVILGVFRLVIFLMTLLKH